MHSKSLCSRATGIVHGIAKKICVCRLAYERMLTQIMSLPRRGVGLVLAVRVGEALCNLLHICFRTVLGATRNKLSLCYRLHPKPDAHMLLVVHVVSKPHMNRISDCVHCGKAHTPQHMASAMQRNMAEHMSAKVG